MGNFKYENKNGTTKGAFNIYQAKSGAIMLLMGNVAVPFTLEQIEKLHINCYELDDFHPESFHQYYVVQCA